MATAEDTYNEYRKRMGASTEKMKRGVETTNKSQSANAIAAQDRMVQNYNAAISQGKYKEGLEKAGDAKWKRNYIEKGLPNVVRGIDANEAEVRKAMAKVAETGNMVKDRISQMPKGTLEDSVARSRESMILQKEAYNKPLS